MITPNIIVIMTDDQGYADLSCAGSADLATPHLDGLAAAGARFTNFYAGSAVCSPSRAALLTGRYPGERAYAASSPDTGRPAACRRLCRPSPAS